MLLFQCPSQTDWPSGPAEATHLLPIGQSMCERLNQPSPHSRGEARQQGQPRHASSSANFNDEPCWFINEQQLLSLGNQDTHKTLLNRHTYTSLSKQNMLTAFYILCLLLTSPVLVLFQMLFPSCFLHFLLKLLVCFFVCVMHLQLALSISLHRRQCTMTIKAYLILSYIFHPVSFSGGAQ